MVTKAWTAFPEVQALAVIGSVAKPLWNHNGFATEPIHGERLNLRKGRAHLRHHVCSGPEFALTSIETVLFLNIWRAAM